VTGPLDVVGGTRVGILDRYLGAAARAALAIPREACRREALRYTWEASADQFYGNIESAYAEGASVPRPGRTGLLRALPGEAPLPGVGEG
jgi:hypothetical protein